MSWPKSMGHNLLYWSFDGSFSCSSLIKGCRKLSKRNIRLWTHATFSFLFLQGGMYLFQIMDFYAASGLSLLWICFFETIAVSWFYGAGRFSKNIEQMLGHRPAFFIFWHYCWLIFAPVVMGVRIYCSNINILL